ncbi:MAG: hypothetical protein Q9O62_01775 [Ardenticatenia bacterium]|nr:hypothetical protein [Ardenticatenia bacterium]
MKQAETNRKLWQKAAQEMGANVLVVLDGAGHLIETVGGRPGFSTETMSSLAAASLAALREIRRLSQIGAGDDEELVLLEGPQGRVFMGKGKGELLFVAVLPPESFLGMARLIFKQLLDREWEGVELPASVDDLPLPSFSSEDQNLLDDFDGLEGFDLDAIWNNGE